MLQNLQDNKQQIEELAIQIQKLKNEQLNISKKVQVNVQELERLSLDGGNSGAALISSYMKITSPNNFNQLMSNNQQLKESAQLETSTAAEHWSFSESSSKSPQKLVMVSQAKMNTPTSNQVKANQNILEQQSNNNHQVSGFTLTDSSAQIKNINEESFFNSKDKNNHTLQGFTLYRQDSAYQQFNTQESNLSTNQGSNELRRIQSGLINNLATNATTASISNQEQQSPSSQLFSQKAILIHTQGSSYSALTSMNSKQKLGYTQNQMINTQSQEFEGNGSLISLNKTETNSVDHSGLEANKLNLLKEIADLKLLLKQQSQQIVQYQEIIRYKDEQLKKQQELEESMKKITQGLLDQLSNTKFHLSKTSQQKQEAQNLLFGLEEEYKRVVTELEQKKQQIKYILAENIQLEKVISETKREYELKMEDKYNSQYNQNYQNQIDSLFQIISSASKVSEKENSNHTLLGNIQKQLTQQIRQINDSELKIQQLRKKNKLFKWVLQKQALKTLQFFFFRKQSQFFSQLISSSLSKIKQ